AVGELTARGRHERVIRKKRWKGAHFGPAAGRGQRRLGEVIVASHRRWPRGRHSKVQTDPNVPASSGVSRGRLAWPVAGPTSRLCRRMEPASPAGVFAPSCQLALRTETERKESGDAASKRPGD